MRLTGPEFSLNPPALTNRVRLAAWIIGSCELTEDVIQKRTDRIDQKISNGSQFGAPLPLRFSFGVNRYTLPNMPFDDVYIDDLIGHIAELVQRLPFEKCAHSLSSQR